MNILMISPIFRLETRVDPYNSLHFITFCISVMMYIVTFCLLCTGTRAARWPTPRQKFPSKKVKWVEDLGRFLQFFCLNFLQFHPFHCQSKRTVVGGTKKVIKVL